MPSSPPVGFSSHQALLHTQKSLPAPYQPTTGGGYKVPDFVCFCGGPRAASPPWSSLQKNGTTLGLRTFGPHVIHSVRSIAWHLSPHIKRYIDRTVAVRCRTSPTFKDESLLS